MLRSRRQHIADWQRLEHFAILDDFGLVLLLLLLVVVVVVVVVDVAAAVAVTATPTQQRLIQVVIVVGFQGAVGVAAMVVVQL